MRDKEMSNLVDILQQELSEAVDVKNDKALKRYIELFLQSVMEREKAEKQFLELHSEIKTLAEVMREGFRQIDKRFESIQHQMDKRFEDMNKRIGFISWFVPSIITLVVLILKFI